MASFHHHEISGDSVNECYENPFEGAFAIENSKADGKTGSTGKVSEKRRQQNRKAQKAMRERRKRADQYQAIHMSTMMVELERLREEVAYLSSIVAAHAFAQAGVAQHPHIQQSPLITCPQTATLEPVPPVYPYSPPGYPPSAGYITHYSEDNTSSFASSPTLVHLSASCEVPMDGGYQVPSGWPTVDNHLEFFNENNSPPEFLQPFNFPESSYSTPDSASASADPVTRPYKRKF